MSQVREIHPLLFMQGQLTHCSKRISYFPLI
jgi:hypothetical protein